MNREHVIRIEMTPVCFVASLGKEHDRVAEGAGMRSVESGCQQVDLRFQDIDALEQARGSVFQMLLQYKTVDELDLTPLYDLETARGAQVDKLTPVDDLHEVQIQERIVEVLAQILQPEDCLVLDELLLVKIGALG
jgi:hypothetical protein